MAGAAAPDPDLRAAVAALLAAGVRFVVIGGFAVIANDYVRATEDIDVLVPTETDHDPALYAALATLEATWQDGSPVRPGQLASRDHARVITTAGILDILREGVAPLDFETVSAGALTADLGDGPFPIAGLASLVAFKRLAGRPRDHNDLLELEQRHGPLPRVHVPGLDDAD